MNMNKTYIDKLAYIQIQNSKILVTLSKGKDTWYIPGGKREETETDLQALTREIKEELTIDLLPETVKLFGIFEAQAHGKPEGTIVRMTCYFASYSGVLKPNTEIEKMDYFDYSKKLLCSPVDNIIFDDLKVKGLIS